MGHTVVTVLYIIYLYIIECVVCVCCHPIYSGRQACGRTSRGHTTGGRPDRISPPSFCAVLALSFIEKDSVVPFPRRP